MKERSQSTSECSLPNKYNKKWLSSSLIFSHIVFYIVAHRVGALINEFNYMTHISRLCYFISSVHCCIIILRPDELYRRFCSFNEHFEHINSASQWTHYHSLLSCRALMPLCDDELLFIWKWTMIFCLSVCWWRPPYVQHCSRSCRSSKNSWNSS